MAETTKPRRRKKNDEPERINLDDWANAGALDGLLSFLNITPENAPINQGSAKVLNLLEGRKSVKQGGPDIHEPITGTPPVIEISTPPVIEAGVPVIVRSRLHPKQATGFGNKRLYRCTLAQEGHSHTEEALYQLLWRAGKPDSEESRLATMGYGEMASRVRLTWNNAKDACQRLIAKLAIETIAREASNQGMGKTYRVHSYRAILERRKACGMEWVIRNKGVEFVTLTAPPDPRITDPPPVIDVCITGTPSITGGGPPSITGGGAPPVIQTPSLLGLNLRELFREQASSSSDTVRSLLEALSQYGQADDDVVDNLILRCRNTAPDCTPSEIVHFIHQKGALILQDRSGRITNPMGFLLAAVPKCLAGETFEHYRQQERKRQAEELAMKERQQAEIEQWRREQEAVLQDPLASEEEKRFARQSLGLE